MSCFFTELPKWIKGFDLLLTCPCWGNINLTDASSSHQPYGNDGYFQVGEFFQFARIYSRYM
jgi:hypothetical protein